MTKPVKVGLRAGGKPPDEFLWSVHYLTAARDSAMEFLNETQYAHVVDAFMSLAREADPRRPITEWVEPVEHYFELKDKGGPLGRINLRVFFTVLPEHRTILVLHAVKKEADGQTPQRTKILVRRRLRDFLAGIYGPLP